MPRSPARPGPRTSETDPRNGWRFEIGPWPPGADPPHSPQERRRIPRRPGPPKRRTAAALDSAADRPCKFSKSYAGARTGAPFHSAYRRVLGTGGRCLSRSRRTRDSREVRSDSRETRRDFFGADETLVGLGETLVEVRQGLPELEETLVRLDEGLVGLDEPLSDSMRLSSRSTNLSSRFTRLSSSRGEPRQGRRDSPWTRRASRRAPRDPRRARRASAGGRRDPRWI